MYIWFWVSSFGFQFRWSGATHREGCRSAVSRFLKSTRLGTSPGVAALASTSRYRKLFPLEALSRNAQFACLVLSEVRPSISVMISGFRSFFLVVSPQPAALGWEKGIQGHLAHKKTRPPRILQ